MATANWAGELAYFQESTQGTGPADAAAWQASGKPIRYIMESVDVSELRQSVIEDMRSQVEALANEQSVLGIKGSVSFKFSAYLTGTGAETAAASQVNANSTSDLLQHCFGGQSRTNSTTLAGGGHTTTVVNVTAATNIAIGDIIGIEYATAPGVVHPREVTNVAALAVTLHRALPSVPANGDKVQAGITIYPDEAVLEDSAVGPYTHSWYIRKGREGSSSALGWECKGCKASLKSINIARNDVPKMDFHVDVASFVTPEASSTPDFSTYHGNAPVAIGPTTELFFGDAGVTTDAQLHLVEASINTGIGSKPVNTTTEVQTGMPGRWGYTLDRQDVTIDLHCVPWSNTRMTEFNAQTLKQVDIIKKSAAGKTIMIRMPRCEIKLAPIVDGADNVLSQRWQLRALNGSVTTNAKTKAKIKIGIL